MKNSTRPRTAVERQARRNYMIFCAASTLGMTAVIGVISAYLISV